jgi:demethylspheroidene O-methyltransferase
LLSADRLPVSGKHAPSPAAGGWRERLLEWRARLLASPRFHRFATSLPFLRPVARREARSLFDLCAGFVYTQVLTTFVELELHEVLASGAASVTSVSERIGLSHDATMRLMVAAESLRLVSFSDRDRRRVVLGELGASLRANPGVLAMIEHHRVLYGDLADPVRLLRGEVDRTALQQYWNYAAATASTDDAGASTSYSNLMAASQQFIADEVLGAYRFDHHHQLMDVGGGNGAFLRAVAARHQRLKLRLFDLPAVAAQARAVNEQAGLGQRIEVCGGSFLTDELPGGADLITLVRIVHDHDDAAVRTLLARVRAALKPGGVLLIAEPMAGTPGAEPMGGAYFGFYLLAMGQGRPRSADELTVFLREAGFRSVRPAATAIPLQTRVLVAKT